MHPVLVLDDVEAAGGVFPDSLVVPADVVGWDADGVGDGFELLAEEVFDEGFDEVYSWAAHQPAKSLVRPHLRMAVNKPRCRRCGLASCRGSSW